MWALQRLEVEVNHASYEASLYGPLCAMFTVVFPVHQQFLVKPQACIRKADNGNLRHRRPAFDSYGRRVAKSALIYPDFVVCRGHAQPSRDIAILVVEVKLKDENFEAAMNQLDRYLTSMTRNRPAPLANVPIFGMLVQGPSTTLVKTLPGVFETIDTVETSGPQLFSFLCQISAYSLYHWPNH